DRRAGPGQGWPIRDWVDGRPLDRLAPRIRERLGEPPIDNQRLAEPPEHDVLGLEVPMDDASVLRVGDCVARVDETAPQPPDRDLPLTGLAQGPLLTVEPLDRLLQGLPLDESHRIIRAAIGISAQAIDRHDPRVLQPASDLGLQEEARLADRIISVVGPELLQSDLAIQFGVESQEDLAQPTSGMRPDDPESLVEG